MRRLFTFVLLALACCGCGSKETPRLTPDQIAEEYMRDSDKADAAYKDKIIIVTGKVGIKSGDLAADKSDGYLVLRGKRFNVVCKFQDPAEVAKLKKGETVSVRGTSCQKGLGLKECQLESSEK